MSERKQPNAKQEPEYTPRHDTMADDIYEKKLVDTAVVTECKPLRLDVSGVSTRTLDAHLHSHYVLLNIIPAVANDARRKEA